MYDPAIVAVTTLKELLEQAAHASYVTPKKDPFEHGTQVGICWGYQQAIQTMLDALSASDQADAQL